MTRWRYTYALETTGTVEADTAEEAEAAAREDAEDALRDGSGVILECTVTEVQKP